VVFRDFYSDEEYQAAAEAFDRLFNDDPDEDLTELNPDEIVSESELSDEDYEQL
jgi:antitoxin component HigA of HigAB toxin-antitoxin module